MTSRNSKKLLRLNEVSQPQAALTMFTFVTSLNSCNFLLKKHAKELHVRLHSRVIPKTYIWALEIYI